MKLIFISLIVLLKMTTLAFANQCPEIRSQFDHFTKRKKILSILKKKNEAAYKKTTNSLKKIKISSNLIIITNKNEKLKAELESLVNKYGHCINKR